MKKRISVWIILLIILNNCIKNKFFSNMLTPESENNKHSMVSYKEDGVHITAKNYLKKQVDHQTELKNLEKFSEVITSLEDEPKTNDSQRGSYELGLLFRSLSKSILMRS
ncbi:hypothetical protein [Vagococcus xieshaowenii]|uniref:Uncharacterized protein n=1 Tax=Vagococcus xieshaowenii TaxID=2562451 RepID=A0AAJ5JQ79_9ENTE|nr:hypothetical protein [Vagococcus xieshaowenii]QCA29443.1 hypothetical protein E4Z98_08980 [Vagococcus xieshaowenii]TFZ39521.1 hypothetical protein E4031_08760 [Vagococcus xieshaowenii]